VAQPAVVAPEIATTRLGSQAPVVSSSAPPRSAVRLARWLPPGEGVEVAGYRLPGGMVYVGERLNAVNVPGIEPALINPKLQVGSRPNRSGESLGYWPSYSSISPDSRAGYLEWLAGGRRQPGTYIGYVFLFFYGLERRVLAELGTGPEEIAEARMLEAEVRGLLQVYGENGSFRRYARSFLDVLRVRLAGGEALLKEAPQFDLRGEGEASFDVLTAVGVAAARGLPLPADWALAWAVESGETRLRTPATRCREEFQALFRVRYAQKHGDGIIPRARKTQLQAQYHPASASFGGMVRLDSASLPEVSLTSMKPLHTLIEECCGDLEAYSRWVGKNPEARHSVAALALLPEELAAGHGGEEVQALRSMLKAALAGGGAAALPATALLRHWPVAVPGKLSKSEAVGFAQTLEKLGYGMEPDPRMGGPVLAMDESAIVFALPGEAPGTPSDSYRAALATLHLAAAVAAADGTVTDEETARLEGFLESSLELVPAEKARLKAHLAWLLERPASTAGLKKRVEALKPDEREALGQLLVEVAVADGAVAAQELKTLSKLYPMLGLDEAAVYSRVHAVAAARPAPAVEPVPMQLPGEKTKGFSIPAPPAEETRPAPRASKVALDMRSVQAKLAETAAVSNLLGSIFAEEEVTQAPPSPSPGEGTVAGLDAAHSGLFRALMTRPTWARSEVEKLAGERGLLTDGALDFINDAAFEVCGMPVLEGDETLQLNTEAVREMTA
jgi:tellurite resistance protein